ncbi:unnamed protein product [Allacma fusca]|uniref:Uncharacterized protein n=1 Tax=Allacma fusca TaxID=39272 RepID=A0A8J2LQ72_9HEXA|nr:unnamed protein product [Allacma fusca]
MNKNSQSKRTLNVAAGESKKIFKAGPAPSIKFAVPVKSSRQIVSSNGDPLSKALGFLQNLNPALVRHSRQRNKFLEEAVNKYDVITLEGDRVLYATEMKGDGRTLENGGKLDVIICLLSVDGEEIVRMEGSLGSREEGAHYTVYHDNTLMGDIMQTNGRWSDERYEVVADDDKSFAVIELSDVIQASVGCKRCMWKPRTASEKLLFDISLPNHRRRATQA